MSTTVLSHLGPATAPLVTAHRGDVEHHRENTLAAVRSAVGARADFVEVDVRVTRDGMVVLLHDSTLARLWEDPRDLSDVAWSDIAVLGRGEDRIPLLADALDLVAGSSSTLLIDMDAVEPAAPSVAVVRQHETAARSTGTTPARVAWCGCLEAVTAVRDLDPEAHVWLPWNRRELPTAELLERIRPAAVNSAYAVLSPALVEAVHAAGALMACWTVDSEDGMRWALALGADAVTTNRLSILRGVIAEGPAAWAAAPRPRHLASEELALAAAVADELAHWAIEYTRGAELGAIAAKANAADHVTDVDVAVEKYVREVIADRLPDHVVVGEELGGTPVAGVPCWYVDPVDGTANLANGVPWTAFSLALAIDHEPLVGVVADVWQGQVFAAVAGYGAELDGERLDLRQGRTTAGQTGDGSAGNSLAGKMVHTELQGHNAWPGMSAFIDALRDSFCTARIMGSGALSVAGPAAERGVGAVIERFSPIDHLASALILREAGGVLLDDDGNATAWPERGGILAAHPDYAAELYALWSSSRSTAKEPDHVV
ncbi:hypothetical protein GCM10027449_02880 [Sinomonas notoginsengisoli]|uniref:inositol monophosphatase family protein n=1 Tax=Sinomonas notoginsengisoli TaxID=1457311 RepID=UPI001F1F1BB8|nr:inositol monophosphatase family protein [Sinomonas notoginsengisoli]